MGKRASVNKTSGRVHQVEALTFTVACTIAARGVARQMPAVCEDHRLKKV